MKTLIAVVMCFVSLVVKGQSNISTYGVQLNCTDLKKSLAFYRDVLGFETKDLDSTSVLLKPRSGDALIIILRKVKVPLPREDHEAGATLTLMVNHIDSTIARLTKMGVNVAKYQKRREGVGTAIYVDDPNGTRLSLLHETVVVNPEFTEPRIYNFGFYVADMSVAMKFYSETLGFPIRSRKYLPLDLPLNKPDGMFGFMLHTREGIEPIHFNSADSEHIVILFKTNDLNKLIADLKEKDVKFLRNSEYTPKGKSISFYDPHGYVSTVIEVK